MPIRLSIVFTSDEHGYLGGAGPIQHVVSEAKQQNPEGTLLVSSGDVFQGAPESDLAGGYPALDVMAKAGYDVVEVGNHDFDHGQEFLKTWIANAPYPVLAGNVIEESTGELLEGAGQTVMRELNGVKVGLVGVVTQETPEQAYAKNVAGLRFEDPISTVRDAARRLREQGAQVIGVLSHLGAGKDRELAEQVEGLDFILGGHTHEFREHPDRVGDTLICQPGSFRGAVGRLDLEFDPDKGRIVGHDHRLIRIDADSVAEDGEVAEVVDRYLKKLEEITGTVVSYTEEKLDHSHFKDDDPLDRIMGEGMNKVAGTTISAFNRKLIRTGFDAGEITVGDLRSAIPFDNFVVKVTVTREQFLAALEKSQARDDERSLVITGYEPGQPLPERIALATTDFLAQGGMAYFDRPEIEAEHDLMRDVLEEELDARILDSHVDAQELRDRDARDIT